MRRRRKPTPAQASRCGGDIDNFAPDLKGSGASSTMLGGGKVMTAELELVVDAGVNGHERWAEAAEVPPAEQVESCWRGVKLA